MKDLMLPFDVLLPLLYMVLMGLNIGLAINNENVHGALGWALAGFNYAGLMAVVHINRNRNSEDQDATSNSTDGSE